MKDRVDKALDILVGYCDKQINCDKCRFANEEGYCKFKDCKIPCDWRDDFGDK